MSEQYRKFIAAQRRVFYFFREKEERGTNYVELDSRPLGLLRPTLDIIVLADKARNRKAWNRAQSEFAYSESQVIWRETSDEWLSSTEKENNEVLSMISSRLNSKKDVLLVPYVVTSEFIAACGTYDFDYVGTHINYHEGKSCLYSNPAVKMALNFNFLGVTVSTLHGVYGRPTDSLHNAAEELKLAGVKQALFKPAWCQGGHGVTLVDLCDGKDDISDIPAQLFEDGWILEEFVDNVKMTVGTTCWGSNVLSVWDGLAKGFCHTGNFFPSSTEPQVVETCISICQKLSSLLNIECPWGIDAILSIDAQGKFQLSVVDINVARFCGGHYPTLFGPVHGISMTRWMASKHCQSAPEIMLQSDTVVKKLLSYSRNMWYVPDNK